MYIYLGFPLSQFLVMSHGTLGSCSSDIIHDSCDFISVKKILMTLAHAY